MTGLRAQKKSGSDPLSCYALAALGAIPCRSNEHGAGGIIQKGYGEEKEPGVSWLIFVLGFIALTWVGDDDCLDEALSVSHVSPRTSLDVLRASATVKKPETFS